jgi:peroxiredoxin
VPDHRGQDKTLGGSDGRGCPAIPRIVHKHAPIPRMRMGGMEEAAGPARLFRARGHNSCARAPEHRPNRTQPQLRGGLSCTPRHTGEGFGLAMKLVRVLQLCFILASATLVYSFVRAAQDGELRKACTALCLLAPNYLGDQLAAPDIELKDLNGAPQRLSSLRGKTVVLVFWTTTCTSCKQQMPSLAEFAQMLRSDDRVALLTVAVDEDPAAVRQALVAATRSASPFPVLLDPESQYVLARYGTRMFPETWIVDPSGVIRARFDGPRDWSSGLAVEMIESISRGDSCPVQHQAGGWAGAVDASHLCQASASP